RLWGSDWSLSLGHYAFASSAEGAAPIWNSVKLALVAGVVGTCVALVTAYVVERTRPPGRRAIEAPSRLPAALPGTVLGLGYILAFTVPPLALTGPRPGRRGEARHLHGLRRERAEDVLGAVQEGPAGPRRQGAVHPRLDRPHHGARRGGEGESPSRRDLGRVQRLPDGRRAQGAPR